MSIDTLSFMESAPAPTYKTVLVNGVLVEMFVDSLPSRISPMRIGLAFWAESDEFTAEEITRLHLAGVDSLPIYESDSVAWEEIE